ncbi:response regulator [Flavobacterium silvaticum]|uniref:histidine kinase n=1 Tax=Flavobacterium silvaticum TaxID=1852020 RepID=A0A972JGB2_9FLAO|nr:response regulator [Flavobacterium silvaticum]NMH28016.1 response regulator [Flavobacterium silvaticum]
MKNNFRRNLFIGFGISVLILLVSSIASYLSIKKLLESSAMVNHTQEVLANLNEASAVMTNAQNGMRGYIITGDDKFLDDYSYAESRTNAHFERLQKLTEDNPKQQDALREILPLRNEFFRYLRVRVEDRQKNGFHVGDIGTGKKIIDQTRVILKKMEDEEKRLLLFRMQASEKNANYSIWLIIIAAILAILISVVFFLRVIADYGERLKLNLKLEEKDKEIASRITAISGIAQQISQGNYKVRTDDKSTDDLGAVGDSLNNMASELDRSFTALSDKEWLQTGRAGLSEAMLGDKDLEQLCRDIIMYMVDFTNSDAAVIYINEGDDFRLMAGYNYQPAPERQFIKRGQGLSGQAIDAGKLLEINGISEGSIRISYALGEIQPTHIVALPLLDSDATGVIEFARADYFDALELEFLSSVGNTIGIGIRAAQNRARVQELLEETQAQSEELRAQHTELESINVELEAQAEKLQASDEELRVQQEELQQANEELSERSVLLEERNTEILQKSEDLERSTRYKSEFLANMSHELRTPLNSILLLSRLLSENTDENMNEEQIEFAKVIQSSGNGLLGLIDEILDLSKIEAGKMDLEFMETSVAEIGIGMHNLFDQVAKEKNLVFKVDAKPTAPVVIKTDRMRLEQILKNLISNALKFTSQGSVTLEVRPDPANSRNIQFSVTDTGIGIPREKQPMVFEAFQQADGSTKRKYGGTGLGLSISRELAKLLKGDIKLESEPGKGSTFTLTIPVYAGQVSDIASAVVENLKPSSAENLPQALTDEQRHYYVSDVIPDDVPDDRDGISDKDKTILIVEDDVNFAKTLLEFTRKRGYKGVVSVRGDHALNLALQYHPSGILLDVQLPMKSGWQVMEELKENALTRHIPVHIMSSHKLRKESLMKGAVNFLDKPVAFEQMPEIFKRIEQIVNRESQKVLILEDNPKHAQALAYFLESHQINSEIKREISEGVTALKETDVDCVILDMGIPDRKAYEVLESIKQNPGLEDLPVIVFTGKSLSLQEEVRIKQYADSIIVKTAHSYQRMLDEISLFLHLVEEGGNPRTKKDGQRKRNALQNVLEGKTVLVVDDDVRNIYSLTKALEAHKMKIISAIDGKEALDIIEKNKSIDVVLLDMMMPNLDGYETATRIRENPKLKELPVIAVTAKAMTGDREKCINAGASDYITKPVDADQLLSLLRVWLYDKK